MEVIYHNGGLYLDNDQFVDIECLKQTLCSLEDGAYFLDWNDRADGYWYSSVPISFIYSPKPKNTTILKILTSYN